MQNTVIKRLLKVFPFIFYAALLFFLFVFVRRIDTDVLRTADVQWHYIVVATLFGLCFRLIGVYIWVILLRQLGAQKIENPFELIYVYAKSWLGRYIPGAATWILGKVYFASKLGVKKDKLAVSSVLEASLQIIVTILLASFLLITDERIDFLNSTIKGLMLFVAVAGSVFLWPRFFNAVMAKIHILLKKKEISKELHVSGSTIVIGSLFYILAATIAGIALFFVAKSVQPDLGYSSMLFVVGVSSLASSLSMLAIFAPGGIGVRESIQVVLFSLIMPAEFALLIAVITRLWSLTVDILFFLLGFVLRKRTI